MQCVYCRPPGFATHRDKNEFTPAEIESLVRHLAANHGLRKVRLTGGEPTTRPDLLEIVTRLAAVPQLQDLALSTNGLTLARLADRLRSAGLRRVNVSLDSLVPDRFAAMTGVRDVDRVLAGISAARGAGLSPKINAVVVRGRNDKELPALVAFAADEGLEIRFIELMPMGPLHEKWADLYVTEMEMRRTIGSFVTNWQQIATGSDSARRFVTTLADGRVARVGFITPMSKPFCEQCDRIRIGCQGEFYPCLMDVPRGNLMSSIRPELDPDALDELLRAGLVGKAPEHPATGHATMITLGG